MARRAPPAPLRLHSVDGKPPVCSGLWGTREEHVHHLLQRAYCPLGRERREPQYLQITRRTAYDDRSKCTVYSPCEAASHMIQAAPRTRACKSLILFHLHNNPLSYSSPFTGGSVKTKHGLQISSPTRRVTQARLPNLLGLSQLICKVEMAISTPVKGHPHQSPKTCLSVKQGDLSQWKRIFKYCFFKIGCL